MARRLHSALGSLLASLPLLLLLPATSHAHREVVGVLQARLLDPGHVEVLLKLDSSQVLRATGLDPEGDKTWLLQQPQGRQVVQALLDQHHGLEAWQGDCQRTDTRLYQVSPSGRWLDIHQSWSCPAPQEYILVRFDWLLDGEGHTVVGHFDDGRGEVQQVYFGRLTRGWFFFPELEPGGEQAPTPTPAPPPTFWEHLWRLLLHAEFFLLPLVFLASPTEDKRTRQMTLLGALVPCWLVATLPVWLGLARRIPSLVGLVALLGLGGVAARHVLLQKPLAREDAPLATLLSLCAGLSVARSQALWHASSWLTVLIFVVLWALFAWAGWALGEKPRRRRAAALVALSVICFLATGELYHLATG